MLLLELLCFDSTCNFEAPPVNWGRGLLVSRLRDCPLGDRLSHLKSSELFEQSEELRPTSRDPAKSIGVATPPRIKRRTASVRINSAHSERAIGGRLIDAGVWLRRCIVVLWLLCVVHVGLVGFWLTGWLLPEPATSLVDVRMFWTRFGARLFLTAGVSAAAVTILSTVAFAGRQPRMINILGVWFRLPARINTQRGELAHLGIVVSILLSVLGLLCASAARLAGG
jgi:hypothetical protein